MNVHKSMKTVLLTVTFLLHTSFVINLILFSAVKEF